MRTALFTVALSLLPLTAMTDTPALCGSNDYYGHDRKVISLDHGEDGTTSGDTRVGHMTLRTADGADVAEANWHTVTLRYDHDGKSDAYVGDYAFEDADGALFGRFMHVARFDFHESEHRPTSLDVAILGGVGAYLGATGSLSLDLSVVPVVYSFKVTCAVD